MTDELLRWAHSDEGYWFMRRYGLTIEKDGLMLQELMKLWRR